MQNGSNIG